MKIGAFEIIPAAWIVWFLYWLVSAFRVKKMRKYDPWARRFLYLAVILLAIAFLFWPHPGEYIRGRFVPRSEPVSGLGAALTVAGVAFSIWARYHLGVYWSGMVGIREGHELIRTGPYARIRHPIYTGILLGLAGTALAIGIYTALAMFTAISVMLTAKAKREESLLSTEFGVDFEDHRRHTGFLFPRSSRP